MPTENIIVNYPFEYYNPAKPNNHWTNLRLKRETALKDYYNSLKPREDNAIKKRYEAPLAEVLKDGDPKWQNMTQKELYEQARIQLENHQYYTKTNDDYYVRAA